MPVTAADGSPLGEVKDVILDPEGRVTHFVIAYGTQPEGESRSEERPDTKSGPGALPPGTASGTAAVAEGRLTVIPWDTAIASLKDGKLVLDGAKLQGAPSFAAHAWPNLHDAAWGAAADAYWHKVVPPPVSAHQGIPVDSTARLRARPTRDGD